MGDVVEFKGGLLSVIAPPPLPPPPSVSALMLDDDQVGEFIALVDDLNYADTRESQQVAMDAVRQAVKAWPDG
jgi:hypothetical protein